MKIAKIFRKSLKSHEKQANGAPEAQGQANASDVKYCSRTPQTA
jgi:hypothetical protein